MENGSRFSLEEKRRPGCEDRSNVNKQRERLTCPFRTDETNLGAILMKPSRIRVSTLCSVLAIVFVLSPDSASGQAAEIYKAHTIKFWAAGTGWVAVITGNANGTYRHSLSVGSKRQARKAARKWIDLSTVNNLGQEGYLKKKGGDEMELPLVVYGNRGKVAVGQSSFGPRLLIDDSSLIPPIQHWAEALFQVKGNAWSLGVSGQAVGDKGMFELEEVGTGYRPLQVDPGALNAIYIKSSMINVPEVAINYSGLDLDTRIQGDANADLLFVDAGTDRVGVGTDAPSELLDVDGGTGIGVIELDGNQGGCFKIRDVDDGGWTYCSTLDGALSCSTSPCG